MTSWMATAISAKHDPAPVFLRNKTIGSPSADKVRAAAASGQEPCEAGFCSGAPPIRPMGADGCNT